MFFFIILIFYIFLFWKLGRTSDLGMFNDQERLKFLVKSNPIEIFSSLHNRWDSFYKKNDEIEPMLNFSDVKKEIEKQVGKEIYFFIAGNSISLDEDKSVFANKGFF